MFNVLLILPNSAFALRAPQIESAAVTPPRRVMLEFGHRFAQNPAHSSRQNDQKATISVGLPNTQQFDIVIPWRIHDTVRSNSAFGDISIMHKAGAVAVLGDGTTMLGGYVRATFPTSSASRQPTGNNYQFETTVLITKASTGGTANLNLGSVIQTDGSELMRYGAGLERVWSKFGLFGEIVGFTDFQDNGINEILSANGGAEFLLTKNFTLDFGGEVGMTKQAPDWSVFGGATYTF